MGPDEISIKKCWGLIAAQIFKGPVSKLQHDEMRRTFYMGFCECFKIMADLSDRLSEEKAADVLSRINSEGVEFMADEIARMKSEPEAPRASDGGVGKGDANGK